MLVKDSLRPIRYSSWDWLLLIFCALLALCWLILAATLAAMSSSSKSYTLLAAGALAALAAGFITWALSAA